MKLNIEELKIGELEILRIYAVKSHSYSTGMIENLRKVKWKIWSRRLCRRNKPRDSATPNYN